MGKSKKKRAQKRKNRRHNPIASQPVQTTAQSQASNIALLQSLCSPKPTDREAACIALAHLFASSNRRKDVDYLISKGILSLMMQRVLDSNLSVRLHVCGALQNLTNSDDPSICDRIVNDDMLTPVKELICTTDMNSVVGAATLSAALQFLRNLCENSPLATSHISDPRLFERLTLCFRGESSAMNSLALHALSLFHSATDQNAALVDQISQNEVVVTSIRACVQLVPETEEQAMVMLHACGIMVNAAVEGANAAGLAEVARLLLRDDRLAPLLGCPAAELSPAGVRGAREEAREAAGEGPEAIFASKEHAAAAAAAAEERSDEDAQREARAQDAAEWAAWKLRLTARMLALEVLTNLVAGVEPEGPPEMAAVQRLLRESGAIDRLLRAAGELRFSAGGEEVPAPAARLLRQWLRRAAGCLDNLVQALGAGGGGLAVPDPAGAWGELCRLCDAELPRSLAAQDLEPLEAVTALMWSVLRANLQGREPLSLGQLGCSGQHVQAVLQLARASTGGSKGTCVNAVGMLGAVGQQVPPGEPLSLEVGEALKGCLVRGVGGAPGSSLDGALATESIHAILDVYGADEQNGNFEKLGLLPVLVEAHGRLGEALGSAVLEEEEELELLAETREVLGEFIQYKRQ